LPPGGGCHGPGQGGSATPERAGEKFYSFAGPIKAALFLYVISFMASFFQHQIEFLLQVVKINLKNFYRAFRKN